MKIDIRHNGAVIASITPNDSACVYKSINVDENELLLKFESPTHIDIPVGAEVEWRGETYTLLTPENLTMVHSEHFSYSLTLSPPSATIKNYKVRNQIDRRVQFPLTATPREHLQLIVDNLNEREQGWEIGDVITATQKLIQYDHTDCRQALQLIADTFKTELHIEDKTISLSTLEKDKHDPLPLQYGKGKGFLGGVSKTYPNEAPPKVVFVQTSDRNIDRRAYGAESLRLPKGITHTQGGVQFETDPEGLSVRIANAPKGAREETLQLTDIYPSRVGSVTNVEETPHEGTTFYDFTDTTIPEELNYLDHLIEGQTMTVIFQSGMLAGREFEVQYLHSERKFKITQEEQDGIVMPEGAFIPRAGDKYAVFNVALPDTYIKEAEQKLLHEACRYLLSEQAPRYTFSGELDPILAKKNWGAWAHKLKVGKFISFTDPRFQPDPVLVRIVGIREYLNEPYSPRVELSNAPVQAGAWTELKQAVREEQVERKKQARQIQGLRERSYQQAREVMKMIEQVELEGFTDPITPATLQTMYAVIGSPKLQFDFVRSLTDTTTAPFRWTEKAGTFTFPRQYLARRQEGDTLTAETKYTVIEIPEHKYTLKDEEPQAYLYVQAGDTPAFKLSTTPLPLTEGLLLIGMVTGKNGERELTTLYGYTELSPSHILTRLIRDKLGDSYWNLETGEFRTKGNFLLGKEGDTKLAFINGTLYIKGAIMTIGAEEKTIEEALAEQARKVQGEQEARERAIEAEQKAREEAINNINAHPPRIGANKNWEVWNHAQQKYIDTGDTSVGYDGKAPEIRDNYWWVYNGTEYVNSGFKAVGKDGRDGKDGISLNLAPKGRFNNQRMVGVEVTATVFLGTRDISDECSYSWSWLNPKGQWIRVYSEKNRTYRPEEGWWPLPAFDIQCVASYNGISITGQCGITSDGKPGADGKDGKDGRPGRDGKDGQPGRDGKDGQPGRDGRDGKDGKNADPKELEEIKKQNQFALDKARQAYEEAKHASHISRFHGEYGEWKPDIEYPYDDTQTSIVIYKGVPYVLIAPHTKGIAPKTDGTEDKVWRSLSRIDLIQSRYINAIQMQVGDMYFEDKQGNDDSISFRNILNGAIHEYMKIGGILPSESQLASGATETREYSIEGVTTRKRGDHLIDSFNSAESIRPIKYTATLSVTATAVGESIITSDGYTERGVLRGFNRSDATTRAYLKLVLRNGSSSYSSVKQTITSPELEVRAFTQEVLFSDQGIGRPANREDFPVPIDNKTKTQDLTITIDGSRVSAGDRVELYLVVEQVQNLQFSNGSASVSNIKNYLPYDTRKPKILLGREQAAFVYARSKQVLFNYLSDAVMKVVGGMLIEGKLQVKGEIQADSIKADGFFACGNVSKWGSINWYKGKQITTKRERDGRYLITHNIGHTRYAVSGTIIGNERMFLRIRDKYSYSCVIELHPGSYTDYEQTYPSEFDFIIHAGVKG